MNTSEMSQLEILLSDEVACESSHKCNPKFGGDGGCSGSVTHVATSVHSQALICGNRAAYLAKTDRDRRVWCRICDLPGDRCRTIRPV